MDPLPPKETGVKFKMYSGIELQSTMYCLFVPYSSFYCLQQQRPQYGRFTDMIVFTHIWLDFLFLVPPSTLLCMLLFHAYFRYISSLNGMQNAAEEIMNYTDISVNLQPQALFLVLLVTLFRTFIYQMQI